MQEQEIEQVEKKNKNTVEDLRTRINRFIDIDLKDVTRFNVSDKFVNLKSQLNLVEAVIKESVSRWNDHQDTIEDIRKSDQVINKSFPINGPYYDISKESLLLQADFEMIYELQNLYIGTLHQMLKPAIRIINQTKDIEVETIHIDKQKEFAEKIIGTYKEELAAKNEFIQNILATLNQQMFMMQQLTVSLEQMYKGLGGDLNQLRAKAATAQQDSVPQLPKEAEVSPKGPPTPEEIEKAKGMDKKEAIRFITAKYPKMKSIDIANLLQCDPTYVSNIRN